jgi:hypothetical protein
MTEKFSLFLVTRRNLGVAERSPYLTFSFTGTQIFLRTSKMVARLRRSVLLFEASLVKFGIALPTFVPVTGVRSLTENTECLEYRL